MKNPTVSVITVSKNSARFIEDNILSVKHQGYPHIEHIVIDGGSTDSTVNILRKYNTVRWISEPDNGVTDAFNKGMNMASGEIVTFLNSDDVYHNQESVSKAIAAMISKPEAGVIFGDCSFIDAEGKVIRFSNEIRKKFNYTALLCSAFTIPQASAFIRRSAIEAIGGKLDTRLDFAQDWELWVRIGLQFPIMYIPEILGSVREYVGATQSSLRCATENPAKRRLILDEVFSDLKLPHEFRAMKKRAYAGTYTTEAFMLLNIDHREIAGKCIWKSIKIYPLNLLNILVISYIARSIGWEKLVNLVSIIKSKVIKKENCSDGTQTIKWWLKGCY